MVDRMESFCWKPGPLYNQNPWIIINLASRVDKNGGVHRRSPRYVGYQPLKPSPSEEKKMPKLRPQTHNDENIIIHYSGLPENPAKDKMKV